MKYLSLLLSLVAFIGLTISVYFVHVNYFTVNVVLYDALMDVAISLLIFGFVFLVSPISLIFSIFERLVILMLFGLVGYALAITVPAVIDRSLSFYILEKIDQRGGGVYQRSVAQIFTEEYLVEHRLVDVRLTEQVESGTIEISGDCVKLTDKGRALVRFSKAFRANWLPRKRLLMGEYTDDLVDTLDNSPSSVNYSCKE